MPLVGQVVPTMSPPPVRNEIVPGAVLTNAWAKWFIDWQLKANAASAAVTTVAGTTNQVNVSGSTGAVTLSLPQAIDLTATPEFARLGLGAPADATALLSVAGMLLATAAGLINRYHNVPTAGWGVPAIYGFGRRIGAASAVANVTSYTVGAADGEFLVSARVLVTTSNNHNFTVTCSYTDETNTAQTVTLPFITSAGSQVTAITNVTGAGAYAGVPQMIRCKAGTTITISSAFVGASYIAVVFTLEGLIQQVA